MMNVKLVPVPGVSKIASLYGRTFNTNAGVQDLSYGDLAIASLGGSGWSALPPHGTTAQRPTKAAQGHPFCDDTINKVIFAQVSPSGSDVVVGWCDMNGNTA